MTDPRPQVDKTLINTRPVEAGHTVYIAPSPLIATYPWLRRKLRRRTR